MVDREKIMSKLKKYFLNKDDVIAVYVFGSLIKGTYNENSDIDLSLMLENKKIRDKLNAFNMKLKIKDDLENLLSCEVDIVFFSQVGFKLQQQIIKGKLIKGKNNKQRIRREQKAIDQYLDMRYFYDMYEEKLGKGF